MPVSRISCTVSGSPPKVECERALVKPAVAGPSRDRSSVPVASAIRALWGEELQSPGNLGMAFLRSSPTLNRKYGTFSTMTDQPHHAGCERRMTMTITKTLTLAAVAALSLGACTDMADGP